MDAIRLRQIDEALGYDKAMNRMVWSLEKQQIAQNPDPTTTPFSQIDAQVVRLMEAAAKQVRLMLDEKFASLSLMVQPGSSVSSPAFQAGGQGISQIEGIIDAYNVIAVAYEEPSLQPLTKQHILARVRGVVPPTSRLVAGLKRSIAALASHTRATGGTDASSVFLLCKVRRGTGALSHHPRPGTSGQHHTDHQGRHQTPDLGPGPQEQ